MKQEKKETFSKKFGFSLRKHIAAELFKGLRYSSHLSVTVDKTLHKVYLHN